jgi:glycosyltransferase involved in cell wall biosynthesis
MRLGIYTDMLFRRDGDAISTRRAFVLFVAALPPRVEEVVIFGRLDPTPGRFAYELPRDGVRFVALPHYARGTDIGAVLRAVRRSRAVFVDELPRLDAVWVFGPHPLAVLFAATARRRGTPLFLGVRQDYPQYIAGRLPSRRWRWAVPAARGLDGLFRLLARRAPTVTLGQELGARYAGGGAAVLVTGFSLVPRAELVDRRLALARSWESERIVLSVGRLDTEKNPLLLADVIARLREHDPRWRLVVAGDGPLRGALEQRLRALGMADASQLLGEVANGPDLWSLYRASTVFLHVSLTEGLPQVLFEAQAAGLPIVATAVGGVSEALHGGRTGLLVGPRDAGACALALERLADDPALREQLIDAGLEAVSEDTLEAQLERLATFFEAVPA